MRMTFWAAAVLMVGGLSGCVSRYTTPGAPADFRALGITAQEADAITDDSIAERLNRRPAASFPANIAVVRVQDGGYRTYSMSTSDYVKYENVTIINRRDVEDEVDMAAIRALPRIRDISVLNRLVLPASVKEGIDLRSAAADVHADVLFVYTFDTRFGSHTQVPFLGTITLGLFPAEQARVNTTVSGAFIDTRTGYVFGLVEGRVTEKQIANLWTSSAAIDQSRRRAEKAAFKLMVGQAMDKWRHIAATFGPAA